MKPGARRSRSSPSPAAAGAARRPLLRAAMGVTCFLAAILSGWCTWTYVATAMAVRTESDGSLVFWYLPFLFAGILLALLSIGAALLWIRLGRAAA